MVRYTRWRDHVRAARFSASCDDATSCAACVRIVSSLVYACVCVSMNADSGCRRQNVWLLHARTGASRLALCRRMHLVASRSHVPWCRW